MNIVRKIFYTTLTTFIIITIYTLSYSKNNVLRTNFELEEIINMNTTPIYLLNNNNYLTKVDIFLDTDNLEDKPNAIIEYLKESNKKIKTNYNGYIPNNTKINNIKINNNILYIDLSEELLNGNTSIIIPGLVRSLLCIENINKVDLKVNEKYIENYEGLLDNKISINSKYEISNRNNIAEVTIYYMSKDNNYIPVTKYLNDDREKIEIIIEELKDSKNSNLISYLNENAKLLDYEEDNNILFLNFNESLNDDDNKLNNTLNEIAYSIFDSYNILSVMFKINDKNVKIINK